MSRVWGESNKEDDSDWLSVSDLMAGLMVIFLFIAIVFIRPLAEENKLLEDQAKKLEEQTKLLQDQTKLLDEQRDLLKQQQQRITEIAVTWQDNEASIYEALVEEFKDDLLRWNAEIEAETLLVRFNAPDVLFAEGKAEIRAGFREILSDFFPRYVEVLANFRPSLDEIRIEGHTSSDWGGASPEQAYYNNMGLSQERTREVLRYVLALPNVAEQREWMQSLLTANGLSSSRLRLNDLGDEDPNRSRRVEFRARTKARTEIMKILEEVN